MDDFNGIRTWIFDLDHTLYPHDAELLVRIGARMTDWMCRELRLDRPEADRLRYQYWQTHGTTLSGLMVEHDVAPEAFLAEVHDVPLDGIGPDPALAARIRALPGRRIVHTNSTSSYAYRVLDVLGLDRVFDAVYGIDQTGFYSKPHPIAHDAVTGLDGHAAETAVMFEDTADNLRVPHARGMRTVLVAPEPAVAPHVHHHTDDLAGFLSQIVDPTFRPSTEQLP
ncbi:pyrimidine 5'-nucleotidase [Palleronia caenipelagi]|uniref:Pyrimidine 5'-nucleotidase n=1 Tax=Palleronia caenipelagi TaxID=2489174 RepID=A0A547Q5T4_9RHOB|nr:pyrimidine 5'-nucleotidase [Palleronia caenipelagi]TRD21741.1 pyrimidine 5'-nucleotidase [Palleronia caenipelagi]